MFTLLFVYLIYKEKIIYEPLVMIVIVEGVIYNVAFLVWLFEKGILSCS